MASTESTRPDPVILLVLHVHVAPAAETFRCDHCADTGLSQRDDEGGVGQCPFCEPLPVVNEPWEPVFPDGEEPPF